MSSNVDKTPPINAARPPESTYEPAVSSLAVEIARRRTFAIISHPDAGKTTLTEKLLLYAGAIRQAGAVRARRGAQNTTSDWMEFEQRRGISISATSVQFEFADVVFNLLDTPGHADFGEDTYRTLCAADTAIMLLDGAKGLEAQTLKLFAICRARALPIITFVNKFDRPALAPLELFDQLSDGIGLNPAAVTWPVGDGKHFAGVIDRFRREFIQGERTAHGAIPGAERPFPLAGARPASVAPERWAAALEEVELLDEGAKQFDENEFLGGRQTPVFFGSALANYGVRRLLSGLIELAPPPAPPVGENTDQRRPLTGDFSAFVFKVQANMNPRHRDRVAFLRICSGSVEPGNRATVFRTGRPIQLKFLHGTFGRERVPIERAVAGDVVAVVGARGLHIGDTVYSGAPISLPPLPRFTPERFSVARNPDVARDKQFRRGLTELAAEGVIQVLVRPSVGMREPILAAAGELQFEVAAYRLADEYGSQIELSPAPWKRARFVDAAHLAKLRGKWGIELVEDTHGQPVALFRSDSVLEQALADFPEIAWPVATNDGIPILEVAGFPR